jgi:alpha-tubulin suppressor-like RCC1 family protein
MGSQHTCALTSAGQAYCWGENTLGQVGDGTRVQRHEPTLVYQPAGRTYTTLAAASYRTCGLTAAGKIYCWGNPNDGHFATDTAVAAPNPGNLAFAQVTVGHSYACGLTAAGKAYCWGANAYGALGSGSAGNAANPAAVLQPVALAFTALSTSAYSTCALTSGDGAFCWGANVQAQLGDGTGTDRLAPVSVAGTF